MSEPICCWRCGATIAPEDLPIRHADPCRSCNADLHVCRLCIFYNPRVADACEEPIATVPQNKERANYCDYFKPSTKAWKPGGADTAQRAQADLDALFGAAAPSDARAGEGGSQSELERLFGLEKE